LILGAQGYRLESHAEVVDLKIGHYTEIGRAACPPEADRPRKAQESEKEERLWLQQLQ
jgi:hypothetical protein